MTSLICGSLAFDNIMQFEGRFSDSLLPDQLHKVNVSFYVPTMRREYGGCAGNIAYNLKLLGGEPMIMATLGQDGAPYLERLEQLGLPINACASSDPRLRRSASSRPMPTATRSPHSIPAQ